MSREANISKLNLTLALRKISASETDHKSKVQSCRSTVGRLVCPALGAHPDTLSRYLPPKFYIQSAKKKQIPEIVEVQCADGSTT